MNEQNNKSSEQRALAEEVLNKIASDSAFRQQLLDDPAGALTSAGFAKRIEDLTSDVSGYSTVTGANPLFSSMSLLLGGGGSHVEDTTGLTIMTPPKANVSTHPVTDPPEGGKHRRLPPESDPKANW